METRTINYNANKITEQKLLIINQQQVAATLVRKGQEEKARQARAKLIQLLFKLDLMQYLAART